MLYNLKGVFISKKTLLIGVFLLLLIIITVALYLIFLTNTKNGNRSAFSKNITSNYLNFSGKEEYPETLKSNLNKLESKSLSENERYKALVRIVDEFSNEYYNTRNPDIKIFIDETIGEYAREKFPEQYIEGDFIEPCADAVCGQPIDNDVNEILKIIEESNLPDYVIRVASRNLTTAGLMPDNDNEKKEGLRLVIDQLTIDGYPEGSKAAVLLKEYYIKKYKTSP